MEASILTSTKKILGLDAVYTAFDLDILTHVNAAFATLAQLGVGPADGFYIEDESSTWDELGVPDQQLSLVKSYFYLKVKMLFDPPTTSFLLKAQEAQIEQFEWRLTSLHDADIYVPAEEES